MITVTKSFLPPLEEYATWLTDIWQRNQLTNNGPLVRQLEQQLTRELDGAYVHFTTNGTLALQLAIRALALEGEIITTPFSYVATTSAILWENCTPVFVDIDAQTLCLDPALIEAAITPRTSAILATHVYGYPCDVDAIARIAERHHLRVIYDGAHAFGTRLKGRSLLTYGDVTACSFHATKLFHTGEGGALVTHQPDLATRIGLLKSFGHVGDEHYLPGINGKASELHAAMGLCLLPRVPEFIRTRAELHALYRHELRGLPLTYPYKVATISYNYAYFPVIFDSYPQLLAVRQALAAEQVDTRRYFFPSLNQLPYVTGEACPVSEDMAARVLCLPFYQELPPEQVRRIAAVIRRSLANPALASGSTLAVV